jgi:hypothetical protein
LSALNAEGASYLVVGGYVLAFHALPRATKDLDSRGHPLAADAEQLFV